MFVLFILVLKEEEKSGELVQKYVAIKQCQPVDCQIWQTYLWSRTQLGRVQHASEERGVYKPMMVMAPLAVAATTASITLFVPVAKLSNSNTPGGLHTIKYMHMKSVQVMVLNYTRFNMHNYTRFNMHTHMHACIFTHAHKHMCMCTHKHTHTHTYTHVHRWKFQFSYYWKLCTLKNFIFLPPPVTLK